MWFRDVGRSSTIAGKMNASPDSIIDDNDRVYLGKVIPDLRMVSESMLLTAILSYRYFSAEKPMYNELTM
jgi:hypothetical protein